MSIEDIYKTALRRLQPQPAISDQQALDIATLDELTADSPYWYTDYSDGEVAMRAYTGGKRSLVHQFHHRTRPLLEAYGEEFIILHDSTPQGSAAAFYLTSLASALEVPTIPFLDIVQSDSYLQFADSTGYFENLDEATVRNATELVAQHGNLPLDSCEKVRAAARAYIIERSAQLARDSNARCVILLCEQELRDYLRLDVLEPRCR